LLERVKLGEKVDVLLVKGSTPEAVKLNNYDLKVMIPWFKHDGNTYTPKNKEGLLLRSSETHTLAMHDGGTCPQNYVAATVADCQKALVLPSPPLPKLPSILLLWLLLALKMLHMWLLPFVLLP
jgi:hypothetical protein